MESQKIFLLVSMPIIALAIFVSEYSKFCAKNHPRPETLPTQEVLITQEVPVAEVKNVTTKSFAGDSSLEYLYEQLYRHP